MYSFSADGMTSAREVKSAPIDTLLYIVRSDGTLVNYTQQRDDKGVSDKISNPQSVEIFLYKPCRLKVSFSF